jgi:lipopolysaccharide export system permease protein
VKSSTSRITRYFLAEFLRPMVVSFAALIVLVMVAEVMEHLDKFIAGKAGLGLVLQYLVSLMPLRGLEVLPVAALLATLFSLGNLSHRNEITAAMSGGIHPWRCVQLILLFGAGLSVLALGVSEWLAPRATRHAKTLWKLDIRHFASLRQTSFESVTAAGEDGLFYTIGLLDLGENRLEHPVVEWTEAGRPARLLAAGAARWEEGHWVFRDGAEWRFDADSRPGSPEAFEERRLDLKESPEELVPQDPESEEMNYREFNRYLRRLRTLGVPTRKQEVELHMKLAFPLTSLIVMLLGIPFAFRKSGGKVRAVGLALGAVFFYFGLMEVGRALGQKPWCPPIAGAWLANAVFIAGGLWRFVRMKELS